MAIVSKKLDRTSRMKLISCTTAPEDLPVLRFKTTGTLERTVSLRLAINTTV